MGTGLLKIFLQCGVIPRVSLRMRPTTLPNPSFPRGESRLQHLESELQTACHRILMLEFELSRVVRQRPNRAEREWRDEFGERLQLLQQSTRDMEKTPGLTWQQYIGQIALALEEINFDIQRRASGLHAGGSDGYALSLALHQLAARTSHPGRLQCEAICTGIPPHLPPETCHYFFQIAQQAVRSAVRQAPEHIEIRVDGSARALTLSVEDNGDRPPGRPLHHDEILRSLQACAGHLRARLYVSSTTNGGTRVVCHQPLTSRGGNYIW